MLNDKGIRGDVLQERGRGSRLGSKDRSGAETQVIGGDVGGIKLRACVSRATNVSTAKAITMQNHLAAL